MKPLPRAVFFAVLATSLLGFDRFDCTRSSEKVEVALICNPAPEGPLKFGLANLLSAMESANLVPRYVSPAAGPGSRIGPGPAADARFRLVVGVAGREPWLEPYTSAAKLPALTKPESFAAAEYVRKDRRTLVLAGSDPTGAMYGLLELAEMLPQNRVDPAKPFRRIVKTPFLEVRGVSPLLTLPQPGETAGPAAGSKGWWFHSEDFWRSYLDLLARSRINFLDLHGMYDIVKTSFTNMHPYFLTQPHSAADTHAARNLAMLNTITALAKERGIRVGLMNYSALVPGTRQTAGASQALPAGLAAYCRQAVAGILTACPDLAAIGFRIGESGRDEEFYKNTYLPAVADAKRKVVLYTHTRGATPHGIASLAKAYQGRFDLLIDYNADQLGAPYVVAGGRFAGWRDYSYQTYLQPPRPYRVLWHVRANGTHRIFHWGDPRFVERAVRAAVFDGVAGLVVEPMNAYYPQHDYFHRTDIGHDYFQWVHQRDWFWHMLWGRIAYDPDTPHSAWSTEFRHRFGEKGGPRVFELLCEMSHVVPLILQSHCPGPDHRTTASELQTGGDLRQFAHSQPFDTFVMQSPQEYVTRQITGRPTAKVSPLENADRLERLAKHLLQRTASLVPGTRQTAAASQALPTSESAKSEFHCISMDAAALAHLAAYYASKIRAGVAYATYEATGDIGYVDLAKAHTDLAHRGWKELASVTARHYRPFIDTLCMHSVAFHWQNELPKLEKDAQIADEARKHFEQSVLGDENTVYIAHTPPRRASVGKPFQISATIASRAKPLHVSLTYRQSSAASWEKTFLRKSKTSANVYEMHLGSTWTPGQTLHYYIEVTYGKKWARYPARGDQDPFAVLITDDRQGPQIIPAQPQLRDLPGGMKELRVAAKVTDKAQIASVVLWHKPLPSESDWRPIPMRPVAGEYVATLPVRSEGLLYAIEAIDGVGNGTRYPTVELERPYLVVEPWPASSAPASDDPTGLKDLARRDLSPERYAAMLVGSQAKALNALPTEIKRVLVDRVSEGLPLVIFAQSAPKDFDFSWLPGKLAATGERYRACKLTGVTPLLEGVVRDFRLPKTVSGPEVISNGLGGGEKEWRHHSEPKALALARVGKGTIVVCQVRVLDTLHHLMSFRLFENTLKVAATDRADKPFVVIDKGNGKLLTALDLAGHPYVLLSETGLLPAASAPAVAPPVVAPAAETPVPAPASSPKTATTDKKPADQGLAKPPPRKKPRN